MIMWSHANSLNIAWILDDYHEKGVGYKLKKHMQVIDAYIW